MALPESWRHLEQAILLQQATGAAKDVLNKGGDIRFKQKHVQQILTDFDINRKPFECIFSELEDQMGETELESYHEVWRAEVIMACQHAEKEIARVSQVNGFQTADIEIIRGYVISKLAVMKRKRKISEASSDIEEAAAMAHTDELSSLENAMKVNLQKVLEAERARLLQARTKLLSSPQKVSQHASTLVADSNQEDGILEGDNFEKCVESTSDALQYAHSDTCGLTLMLPAPQGVFTIGHVTPESDCDFPYKVFSDDDASLPVEIPDGLRCACPLGCIKVMQYCSSEEIAMGKCHGCRDCKGKASACKCWCECLGCEQEYRLHIANIKMQSAFKYH